ncbi:MAG: hypothetical protein EXQ49_03135 [Acidobacteria bacterium]|nr:hypothetical protein [Acidobacteriota bacterium]
MGCLAAVAGGYMTLRPAASDLAQAEALSPETKADPAKADLATAELVKTEPTAPAEAAVFTLDPTPAPLPARPPLTTIPKPAARPSGNAPAPVGPASSLAAPAETPVTQAPPVSVEPPVTPPTQAPVPVEPPRYVPDAPVQTAAPVSEPQRIQLEELTVEKHSVIGIRLDEAVSTRTARLEDRVSAVVSRDVTVDERTAIPAGTRLEGTVSLVERGGKFRNRPRIGLRFDRMIMADGMRVPIKTDTIYREGDSPTADATAKVGAGAVAGAILGGLLGGKKGAAIGTAAGAAGGAATVMNSEAGEASIAAGAPLTVRLAEEVTVAIRR